MKNKELIINDGPGFNINLIENDLNDLDLKKILNEPDHVFHQAALPGAPGSKAIRPSVLGACECQDQRVWDGDAGLGRWAQGIS